MKIHLKNALTFNDKYNEMMQVTFKRADVFPAAV